MFYKGRIILRENFDVNIVEIFLRWGVRVVSYFVVLSGLELTKRPGWLQTPGIYPSQLPKG